MRKFKKVIAGIIATASIMTCMALPASAETISIKRGDAGSQANIIGAKQVYYRAECSSSSGSSADFRLAYSVGSNLYTVHSFSLDPGDSYENMTSVFDTGKMWMYSVFAPNNKLNAVASGTILGTVY